MFLYFLKKLLNNILFYVQTNGCIQIRNIGRKVLKKLNIFIDIQIILNA